MCLYVLVCAGGYIIFISCAFMGNFVELKSINTALMCVLMSVIGQLSGSCSKQALTKSHQHKKLRNTLLWMTVNYYILKTIRKLSCV